jgi:titin
MKHHPFTPRAAAAAAGLSLLLVGGTATGALAATSAPAQPSAPTGLTATPGDGSATLSWSVPASQGGSAVQDYRIVGGTSPSSDAISDEFSSHAATISGLADGTLYYFSVYAENDEGSGPAATVQVTPTPPVVTRHVPGVPARLKVTGGDGFVGASWSAPKSDGGFPVDGYHVYVGLSQSMTGAREFTTTKTSFQLTDVENGSEYFVQVGAFNGVGPGPLTAEGSVFTGPRVVVPTTTAPPHHPTPHSALIPRPTGLSARPGHGQVVLSWSRPAGGLKTGDGYVIYVAQHSGGEGAKPSVPYLIEFVTTYTIAPLRDGTRYYFQVALVRGNKEGPRSAEISAVPTPRGGSSGGQGSPGGGTGGTATPTPILSPLPGGLTVSDQTASSSGLSSWLVGLLAGLGVAVAGGGLAAVVLRRRRYGAVPAPRQPYDDQPSDRDEELNGPRYH